MNNTQSFNAVRETGNKIAEKVVKLYKNHLILLNIKKNAIKEIGENALEESQFVDWVIYKRKGKYYYHHIDDGRKPLFFPDCLEISPPELVREFKTRLKKQKYSDQSLPVKVVLNELAGECRSLLLTLPFFEKRNENYVCVNYCDWFGFILWLKLKLQEVDSSVSFDEEGKGNALFFHYVDGKRHDIFRIKNYFGLGAPI